MKKNSRLGALLLAIILLFGSTACSSGSIEETTEITSASTTAPETTEAITEETTEESTTAVAPPETEPQTTTPPETTTAPETEPPKPQDRLRIIMQTDKGEALLSALADEQYKNVLAEREKTLLYSHAAEIELSRTEDLESMIKNLVLSGEYRFDLVLTDPAVGIELLSAGVLENLNTAGISITPDAVGVRKSITESLSVGGGVYLFASDALVSDIKSAYAIKYSGAPLSSNPTQKALAGEFTAELMLTYIAQAGDAFSMGEGSPLTLFGGAGGEIFTKNEQGALLSAVRENTLFTAAYESARGIYSKSTQKSAIFTLGKLSPLGEGEAWLPIPKASADVNYSTPIDYSTVYLFAVPIGVVSGNRLNKLVTALASSSNDYREAVRTEIIGKGNNDAADALNIIENSAKLDLGILLGWGDLCEYISDGLKKDRSAADIFADRMTEMRNKVAETAASIFAEKLGIK